MHAKDVSYGQIDMTKGVLEGLEKHLSTILLPALKSRTVKFARIKIFFFLFLKFVETNCNRKIEWFQYYLI